MQQKYITPSIKVVQLITDDSIAQFVISSHSVGENQGLAKGGYFEEEFEDEDSAFGMSRPASMTNYSPWAEE